MRDRLHSRRLIVSGGVIAALLAGGAIGFVLTGDAGQSESSGRGQVLTPDAALEEEARKASALAGFEVVAPVLPAGFQHTGTKVDAPENGPVREVSMAFKGPPFPISITQSSVPVRPTNAEALPSPVAGAEFLRATSEFGFTGYSLITKTRSYALLVETKFAMDEAEVARILASMVK